MLALPDRKEGSRHTQTHTDTLSLFMSVCRTLTVWLFSMNCTALSFTSFLTLLYVQTGSQGEHTHTRLDC